MFLSLPWGSQTGSLCIERQGNMCLFESWSIFEHSKDESDHTHCKPRNALIPRTYKTSPKHPLLCPAVQIFNQNFSFPSASSRCTLQVAEAELSAGRSVVVDNTNPGAATRADYIKMAKKHGRARASSNLPRGLRPVSAFVRPGSHGTHKQICSQICIQALRCRLQPV